MPIDKTVADTRPAPPGIPHSGPLTARYQALGLVGAGGLGVVLRAHDHRLGVDIAMKLLHSHLVRDAGWLRRFDEEARLLATLAHPGIPPVHDLDRLPDGRPFYTMALIEGERWADLAPRLSVGRRVALLRDIAQTVGWAHQKGVIHRDLSPNNVLVQRDGRARVIDWGLARRLGELHVPVSLSERAGTPGFAAPELAAGEASPCTDVYALGALLGFGLFFQTETAASLDDPDLRALWAACLSPRSEQRPQDGAAVAAVLQAWLDGDTRRARAQRSVQDARDRLALARDADQRAVQARDLGKGLPDREAAWLAEDRAAEAEIDAARRTTEAEQALHIALHEDGACEEAHAMLTGLWREQLNRADEAGHRLEVARLETSLRGWRGGRYAALADGHGRLALDTEPPAQRVIVQRYVETGRRLVAVEFQQVTGPQVDLLLPAGSYRLLFERGASVTPLPLRMPRGGQAGFIGRDGALAAVPLAPAGLDADDCYIAGGWYRSAPDPGAADTLDAELRWLDPYVLRRVPVTVGEWLDYLDDLARTRGIEAALAAAPRELIAGESPRILARRVHGRFEILGDEAFPLWPRDWPVTLIDWEDARAYAAWRAARDGLPWRLPTELEWEMAGRGADGRVYAWGNHMEPGWACNALTVHGAPGRGPVTDFPIDESPYGVRAMTGNVREWCVDTWRPPPGRKASEETLKVIRGGSWTSSAVMCRLAMRFAGRPTDRLTVLGLRLARGFSAEIRGS